MRSARLHIMSSLKDKVPLNSKKIINKAEVYSKTYERTYADKTFEPTIGYNMSKKRDGATLYGTKMDLIQ